MIATSERLAEDASAMPTNVERREALNDQLRMPWLNRFADPGCACRFSAQLADANLNVARLPDTAMLQYELDSSELDQPGV